MIDYFVKWMSLFLEYWFLILTFGIRVYKQLFEVKLYIHIDL